MVTLLASPLTTQGPVHTWGNISIRLIFLFGDIFATNVQYLMTQMCLTQIQIEMEMGWWFSKKEKKTL